MYLGFSAKYPLSCAEIVGHVTAAVSISQTWNGAMFWNWVTPDIHQSKCTGIIIIWRNALERHVITVVANNAGLWVWDYFNSFHGKLYILRLVGNHVYPKVLIKLIHLCNLPPARVLLIVVSNMEYISPSWYWNIWTVSVRPSSSFPIKNVILSWPLKRFSHC